MYFAAFLIVFLMYWLIFSVLFEDRTFLSVFLALIASIIVLLLALLVDRIQADTNDLHTDIITEVENTTEDKGNDFDTENLSEMLLSREEGKKIENEIRDLKTKISELSSELEKVTGELSKDKDYTENKTLTTNDKKDNDSSLTTVLIVTSILSGLLSIASIGITISVVVLWMKFGKNN